jgi:hypothetical protein
MPTTRSIVVELTMATPVSDRVEIAPAGFAAISRVVVSAAADLVGTVERAVIGDAHVRTARGNAWDALCADRARAQARDEMEQLVRTLLATGPRTSATASPRAAQAEPRPAKAESRAAQGEPRPAQAESRAARGEPRTVRAESRAAQRATQPTAERAAQATSRASRTRPASQNRAAGQHQRAAKSRRGGKSQRAVGSSPRSNASQAALVSTGSTTR